MKTSNNGIELIKRFESFASKPYLCPAKAPTIGYGSTMYANGAKVTLNDRHITKEEAEELLRDTLVDYELAVDKNVEPMLNQNQFDALVSFTYNVGIGAFKKSTLLRKLNANLFDEAANEFGRWNKVGGVAMNGLTKRREAEKRLFSAPP